MDDVGADDILVDGPVVTDSRGRPGSLYVARVGESMDGHLFVPAAKEVGAVAALTTREVDGLPCVVVDDIQDGFAALAQGVLQRRPDITVVGVTGSSGKTSTKDLLASVLSTAGPTVAPVGSLNSEVGVPLTICRITPDTRFLIVEMGARGIGHIDYLAGIAAPSIGIVLNVGSAHVGEFGSREAIGRAKAELVAPCRTAGCPQRRRPHGQGDGEETSARALLVGADHEAGLRATDIAPDSAGRPSFTVEGDGLDGQTRVSLPLHGEHHVGNALAVIAVALECGLPVADITAALATATPASRWRMEVTERPDGVTVVNDAYNANPDSMRRPQGTRRHGARPADVGRAGVDARGRRVRRRARRHRPACRAAQRLPARRRGGDRRPMASGAQHEGSWGDEVVGARCRRRVPAVARTLDRRRRVAEVQQGRRATARRPTGRPECP